MIKQITYIESPQNDPYQNLAVEEYLLLHCKEGQCILYLWQNKKTIVIGRNQNAWKECLVDRLDAEGGYLTRRLSGGGAVYQDLGNLNFTFLIQKTDYDVDRQLEVITRAVRKLGAEAVKSGRNDILVKGKKFSGNAYYEQGQHCYHHGTLMVNVNLEDLTRYLTVSKEKLAAKGVDSVRSRVVNLTELIPGLTVEALKEKLLEAFEEVYGLNADILKVEDLDQQEVKASTERLASRDWIFGRKFDFQYELSHRFPWGQVTLQLKIREGNIEDAAVSSDSMKPFMMLKVPELLRGIPYNRQSICLELGRLQPSDAQEAEMMEDMAAWLQAVDL